MKSGADTFNNSSGSRTDNSEIGAHPWHAHNYPCRGMYLPLPVIFGHNNQSSGCGSRLLEAIKLIKDDRKPCNREELFSEMIQSSSKLYASILGTTEETITRCNIFSGK
ncbi:4Fe-4S dicluster domain-containing protein [Sesbania bispinosa]|nr:4Fe-4S dicluster domain-containing protein [Sesbania bispinosa]